LAQVLRALAARAAIEPELIDDVIAGCVTQAGEQSTNLARSAVLAAGFPESVPATTVDRQCGSSQQAIHFAAQAVQSGHQDVVIACGVESMSRAPMWSDQLGRDPFGEGVAARYPDGLVPQGLAAELVSARYEIGRDELDDFAAHSHHKAADAAAAGWFDSEIVPVDTPGGTFAADETIRAGTSVDALAKLKPAFYDADAETQFPEIDWRITAGNASPLTDGAAAALVVSKRALDRLGLRPRARVHSLAVAGSDPVTMLTGVVPATEKLLARASVAIHSVDVAEVNEAFACVPILWQRHFGLAPKRLNPHGGAIALGHPLGASGARLLATMLGTLERTEGRFGLQAICEAGGMANAMLVERVAA
jgi:acetyl-CoA acyltransferase